LITISGYKLLQQVCEDARTILYRALREEDETPLLVRIPRADHPCAGAIERLRSEYEIINNLPGAGILRPVGLVECDGGPALILEDFSGIPLEEILSAEGLAVSTFLDLGSGIAAILSYIHENKVIHSNINPRNILINSESGEIKITGFCTVLAFSESSCSACDIDCLRRTLAYISPEKTGRINRPIDYRSDLYSLGTIFHHMLTGAPPFLSDDPLELVYQHIAKKPALPETVKKAVPSAISAIVMKLLSKSPDDRYQGATAVKGDLLEYRSLLESGGDVGGFRPGRHDVSGIFRLPQKLYGRQQEIAAIMGSFSRSAGGAREMLLVSGYSGIGKSSLVHEVRVPIAMRRGYFISGKFDQNKLSIPYSALIEAFRGLLCQILGESDKRVMSCKERLLDELGPNVRVIIEVIPEVALITGEQPPLPELPPQEAENRFHRSFSGFIHVLCGAEHPLALFLDDLQWVDQASLKLLRHIATDPTLTHLLIIGAYRDNEVEPSHILMFTLDEIQRSGTIINRIILTPLAEPDMSRMIADTVQCDVEKARSLADLIMRKTCGNPFFARQFLHTLHDEGLLSFDFGAGAWQWDLARIHEKGITDNVVELMANKLLRLSPETVGALTHAACMGNTFSLETLAVVLEREPIILSTILAEALREGPIVAKPDDDPKQVKSIATPCRSEHFAFQHDRIQQAAYSLIPDEGKKAIHLKIGRLLLRTGISDENLFEIVGHLNCGLELMENPDERRALARLNLEAGRRAKKETAYAAGRTFFATGTELLSPDCWSNDYDLAYPLYLELAECEYLTINFDEAERLYDLLLYKARTRLERVHLLGDKVILYEDLPDKALVCGFRGLKELGIIIRPFWVTPMLLTELMVLKWRMRNMAASEVLHLPAMTDREMIAAMNLLMRLIPCAYFTSSHLAVLIAIKMVALSLKYGNTECAPYAYATYGVVEGFVLGNALCGKQFGEIALTLCHAASNQSIRAKVENIFSGYINPWTSHVRTSREILRSSFKRCLENGDLVYATYNCKFLNMDSFICGELLDTVFADAITYADFCLNSKVMHQYDIHVAIRQTILNLRGMTNGNSSFSDQNYDEEQHVREMRGQDVKIAFYDYCVLKAYSYYIFGDYRSTFRIMAEAEKDIFDVLLGILVCADCSFLLALSAASLYPHASIIEKIGYSRILRRNRRRMKKWADNCPENFLHKHLLIEAEVCRAKGKHERAAALYDQAILSAREQGYIQIEAIANECAARFQLGRGEEAAGKAHLAEAYRCYAKWGASGKVKAMEEQSPGFRRTNVSSPARSENPAAEHNVLGLDMLSVVKASQAISSSFDLDRLLENLMEIVIRHAGARKGALIMEKNGRLQIAVERSDISGETQVRERPVVDETAAYPSSIVNYVARSGEMVILNEPAEGGEFAGDPYIMERKPRSVMCLPLIHQSKRKSILYLENNLSPHAFTSERIALLNLLTTQIAVSLENALLHKEKADILRCVHDSLSSDIYNIFLLSEMRDQGPKQAELPRRLSLISEISQKGLQTIRDFLFLTARENLAMGEFCDMLSDYGHKLFENSDAEFTISRSVSDTEYGLAPLLVFNIYMIYKEALTNVLKHAGAGKVSICLSFENYRVALSIQDDGQGFDVGSCRPDGNGVNNMRVRADEVGASLTFESGTGGTRIGLVIAV
jgi:predicted ATPase/signal transduction histidine kinase/tRNA A-37 threonylcarbamoyl transferase component Bud32